MKSLAISAVDRRGPGPRLEHFAPGRIAALERLRKARRAWTAKLENGAINHGRWREDGIVDSPGLWVNERDDQRCDRDSQPCPRARRGFWLESHRVCCNAENPDAERGEHRPARQIVG